jgi:hypothetical protein
MRSLRATTLAISEAWLGGDVSGAYARTALEQTFQLVQEEHHAVAATSDDLAHPAANRLAGDGERLSRIIAALTGNIRSGDDGGVRRHVADLQTSTWDPS